MKKILRPTGGHILDIDSLELSDQVLSLAKNVNMRRGFPSRNRGRRSIYSGFTGGDPNPITAFTPTNVDIVGTTWTKNVSDSGFSGKVLTTAVAGLNNKFLFKAGRVDRPFRVGFSSDTASSSVVTHCINFLGDGTANILDNGSNVQSLGAVLTTDLFEVDITAAGLINYYKNSVLLRSATATGLNNANCYAKATFGSSIGGAPFITNVFVGMLVIPLPAGTLHLLNFQLNNFNWWLQFRADSIKAFETNNLYDVSIAGQSTVSNPYEWSSTLLNGIPCFTNGKNAPHYWTGDSADNAIALPGFPASTLCKFIVAFRFHLFALNIDSPSGVFDNLILWSDAAAVGEVPASWTPGADNEAGSAFLADTPGRCIAGVPLGTQLMIYKPTSFHAVEYAGQPPDNIFTVRPVTRSIGLVSPHALKTIGTQQAVIGNDDVVLTDGINIRSIADSRIKQALKNSIDETNSQNVFTIYDENARELHVCIPESGSQFATLVHIWDERRDNWVTKDLNAVRYGTAGIVTDTLPSQTWDADSQTWDADLSVWNETQQGGKTQVVNAEDSFIYVEDVPEPTLFEAVLQRQDLFFDDAEQRKVTSRVMIEGKGTGLSTLLVRLGSRNSTEDSVGIAWGPYVQRKAEGNEYEVTGRFISVEVRNDTSSEPWTVTRITIEAEYDGTF